MFGVTRFSNYEQVLFKLRVPVTAKVYYRGRGKLGFRVR